MTTRGTPMAPPFGIPLFCTVDPDAAHYMTSATIVLDVQVPTAINHNVAVTKQPHLDPHPIKNGEFVPI